MTIVVITCLTIIFDVSGKICSYKFFYVTATSTNYFYSLGLKDILGSLAHITRQHNYNTHLTKYRSYSAFAAAAFR